MANVPTTPQSNPRTVLLIGDLARWPLEGRAGGTITPGMLIKPTTETAHPYQTYIAHATAGGRAPFYMAIERGWPSDPIDAGVGSGLPDDDYVDGQFLKARHCQRGEEVWVLLPALAAAVILTDKLTSNGNGMFKKSNGSTDHDYLEPLEAVNNSAGASAVRIRGRII